MKGFRVGSGLDVHAFSDDPTRALVLGGAALAGEPGLAGHSDADVVAHAVADALLGACALGDLGTRFGAAEPELAGVRSATLLTRVVEDVTSAGWSIENVDLTLVAQRPRLATHQPAIRRALAEALGLSSGQVSVKVTSTDRLGTIGRGEGIACWATCLVSGP